MSTSELADIYIHNGYRLHRNVDITMVYLNQMNSGITREYVLAVWDQLDSQSEIPF